MKLRDQIVDMIMEKVKSNLSLDKRKKAAATMPLQVMISIEFTAMHVWPENYTETEKTILKMAAMKLRDTENIEQEDAVLIHNMKN